MRHRRTFFLIILAFLLILFSARTSISYYVDSLWFGSLGYSSVFWRTLRFEWLAFTLAFIATFVILFGWFTALRLGCRTELRDAGTVVLGNRTFQIPVDSVLQVGALIGSLFVALLAGGAL